MECREARFNKGLSSPNFGLTVRVSDTGVEGKVLSDYQKAM